MAENGNNDPKPNGMSPKPHGEPTECDPCMEEAKTKDKLNFFHRYRDQVSEKTGLSYKGVYVACGIVAMTFLLLLTVIVLAACWPRIPHKFQFPVCEKAECLRAAAQIRESLNSSVSPCENVWEAACGSWLRNNPLPKDRSIWNYKQQVVRKELEQVRDIIATLELPLHTNTLGWKLRHLYESCVNVDDVNAERDTPLKNIISELGGWGILKGWNYQDFDKDTLLRKLHERYGVSPFFKITVEPNPIVPGQNNIRISPSGLGLPDKEYYFREDSDKIQQAYKEYIRDVVIYMSSARNEATKFGNDIFSYEKRIAEITPDRVMLQNPITTYNIISISELRETNLIKFYDILLAMYKDSQITDQTEVIVTSIEYLHQIAQIISTTDRKTMNGYLIWTLVREYVPFLSDKYTSVLQNFHSNLYGIEEPMQRWEYCAKLTNRFMGLAVNYFREKKDPLTKETMQIVNTTFDSVVVVARRKIKTDKITNGLYEHLNTKLLNLRLQIGVPKAYSDLMFLKDYYLKFKIINHNFFENVKSAMEFQKKIEERRLSKSPPEETILSHVLAETPKVVYSASDHAVVVPRMLVKEPIFETHFPRAIIFGRLGHEISEAVISSILPYGSVWTAEKKILSPFHRIVDDSFKSVELTRNCLSKFIMETGNDISDIFANETALTTSIHLSALDVAEKALGLSLEKSIHLHQPALENFEDTALFFLAYAQTQCSESTRQQQFYDIITEFKLDHKSRLKLAWTQIPEFSQSLGCDFNKHFQCQKLF